MKQSILPYAMGLRRSFPQERFQLSSTFLQQELSGMRIDIFGDNEGSKAIADFSSASRSKHIDVKLHFIRGQKSSMQMS